MAPKPEYTPEPEYNPFAKKRGLQGVSTFDVVVGSDGKVHKVLIVRPLGLGLDEQAAEAISRWKFTTAMRDGCPVACAFDIEVDFHVD